MYMLIVMVISAVVWGGKKELTEFLSGHDQSFAKAFRLLFCLVMMVLTYY